MDSDTKACSVNLSETATTMPPVPASAPAPESPSPKVIELSEQQKCELELLYILHPRPTSALLHRLVKDRPALAALDKGFIKAWFVHRRLKEERDKNISSLIHKHAELKAEQHSLLLRNSKLRSQALLLNLENQQLRKQLEEMQLEKQKAPGSDLLTASSVTVEEPISYSDDEECDNAWTSDDSCSS